ncbi:MAG: hypothetical protein ABIK09_00205 [Pseudomonadota bacterium]
MSRVPMRSLQALVVAGSLLACATEVAAGGRVEDLLCDEAGGAFEAGEGWSLDGTEVGPEGLSLRFTSPAAPDLVVLLSPRDDGAPAFQRTPSFNISHLGPMEDAGSGRGRLLHRVVDTIRRNDPGDFDIVGRSPVIAVPPSPRARDEEHPPRRPKALLESISSMAPAERLQVRVVLLLLLGSLAALGLSVSLQARAWRESAPETRPFVAAALALGLLIRLLVAPRVVMIYMAFGFTQEVSMFEGLPRYGAGAFTLYRLLFELFPTDHLTIIQANTCLGFLTIPAILAFVQRHRPRGLAVAVLAVLLNVTPMFICDHRTESILVVAVFFLWHGLLLLDGLLAHGSRWCLAGALPLLGLAALCRPEMIIIVPVAVGVVIIARAREGLRGARIPLGIAGCVLAMPLGLQLHHLLEVVPTQIDRGAIPALDLGILLSLPGELVFENGWLDVWTFPVGVTLMAFVGLLTARRGRRTLPLGLGALAVVWTLVYVVDAPLTSLPRLHAPAAALVGILAALGVDDVRARLVKIGGRMGISLAVGVGVLVLGSALPSIPSLFAPTNELQDERFFRRAVAALPDTPICLVRIGPGDSPPRGRTHRYHPDYLVTPPNREGQVSGIAAWEAKRSGGCADAAYFYLGLLCYAEESTGGPHGVPERVVQARCLWGEDCWRAFFVHHEDATAPPRRPLVSACAHILDEGRPVPVLEEDLPNVGDNEFGYYPEVPTFRVGLYRLSPAP